jgi:hypothetical protein
VLASPCRAFVDDEARRSRRREEEERVRAEAQRRAEAAGREARERQQKVSTPVNLWAGILGRDSFTHAVLNLGFEGGPT